MVTAGADSGRFDLRALLHAVEAADPVDVVDVLAAELAVMVDAAAVSLLIATFTGDAVVRMSHVTGPVARVDGGNERTELLPLPASLYERVLFTQEADIAEVGHGSWRVLLPVTERGDAMGLLELSLPTQPEDDVVRFLAAAAHAFAYVLVASRRHTDLFEWAQRDTPFSLPAEIQRRLLPASYTIESSSFTLAGWLEPAAHVGGDTFDYAVDRENLYASVTDAMGHSTQAALLATLAVGSLRNTRRSTASPAEQAQAANDAVIADARSDQFVTGLILRIRLADGRLEIVNAGHPPPYLLRGGRGGVLDVPPSPALGVTDAAVYAPYVAQLEDGDRVLLLTDGFLERNAAGVDIPDVLESTAARHPREIVREFAANVLRVTDGNLRDDATVVCIDWFGEGGHRRASGGASSARVTSPEA